MRRRLAQLVHEEMSRNEKVYVLIADVGYAMWDRVQEAFPERFFNCGSAENCMVGVAVGLAQAGKIPLCYTLTSFLLYRPFEMLRNYVGVARTPIKLIGSGRDKDYGVDGYMHWADATLS